MELHDWKWHKILLKKIQPCNQPTNLMKEMLKNIHAKKSCIILPLFLKWKTAMQMSCRSKTDLNYSTYRFYSITGYSLTDLYSAKQLTTCIVIWPFSDLSDFEFVYVILLLLIHEDSITDTVPVKTMLATYKWLTYFNLFNPQYSK